ncbi:14-3-3 protein 1 [Eutrema salsugineum]|uniref:14-3-3 protein 1 n=1 Tax=Eutrema salsugineum TaxID=72664 RepID=UPI000CED7B6D|nr:14-3-3 protein 1 [Eutrema salsugineum]
MMMSERVKLFHSVVVADVRVQYDVLVEALKNIQKLEAELTVGEKNCIRMVHNNLICEMKKTWNTLKAMKLKERVEGNDNLEMVQEYLQKQLIDLKSTSDEIKKLLGITV